MRKPIVAGNWKMNGSVAESRSLAAAVASGVRGIRDVEVIVAPPHTALLAVSRTVGASGISVAAQDMHWRASGAYTGAVSPVMVKELAGHVIIGHSERRQLFGETDETVRLKIVAARDHDLVPILCVGETSAELDAGVGDETIARQIREGLAGVAGDVVGDWIVAYEPVWAIGTGRACEPDAAARIIDLIRGLVRETCGAAAAERVRILYGGSVNRDNIEGFVARPGIDGALVGGASLDADGFAAMVAAAARLGSDGHGAVA